MSNTPFNILSLMTRGEKAEQVGPTPETVGIDVPEKPVLIDANLALLEGAEYWLRVTEGQVDEAA